MKRRKQTATLLKRSVREISLVFSFTIIFLAFATCTRDSIPVREDSYTMKKAVPVWAQGRETEMNLTAGFRGNFKGVNGQKCSLKVTASALYRVFLNGEFLGYGPARACHGYFRVDEYDIGNRIKDGDNILSFEVAGYNVNTYYTLDQPSFFQAEVISDGNIVLATGSDPGFEAFIPGERVQKVERYSFQRPFIEYYRLKNGHDQWKRDKETAIEPVTIKNLDPVKLLPRNVLIPEFGVVRPVSICMQGTVKSVSTEKLIKDRSLTQVSAIYKAFPETELEVVPSLIIQQLVNASRDTTIRPYKLNEWIPLAEKDFCLVDFGTNLSGFIGAKVSCDKPSRIMFYFDEILTDGDVMQKKRMRDINNIVTYELGPGTYNLETFESYTCKYLKIIALEGNCTVQDIYLREYAYPENKKTSFHCSNEKLNEIYKAARQTFRQNTVDIFMDCPSRERGGWLCDSYFTAIMEKDFTGSSAVARNFYENYALPVKFAHHPEGMIPMCYPGDHPNGNFIPNWALWFIIQVHDYAQRGGDAQLIEQLKPRIEGILKYFTAFENEDGLLENLEKWIFVEWSKANSFVKDVNYPTNMLYSAALSAASSLYENDIWRKKSEHVKQMVLKQSYNGTFFVDNAVRNKDKKLEVTSNTTEACQYYAFFLQIATPETHPDLWAKLKDEFGPERNVSDTYPLVFKANAFIGNYLRMDILSRYGLNNQLLREVQDYFYYMAQRTGTLWENVDSHASCNHGFASYIGHVLYRDILGIWNIDYLKKKITIRFSDIDLAECSGVLPVDEEYLELSWKRISGNQIQYAVKAPEGYKVRIENLSSSKLIKEK